MRALDLTDHRFGRLTAIEFAGRRGRYRQWACVCDCGRETVVDASNLRAGHTTSCGCVSRENCSEIGKESNARHGHAVRNKQSAEYRAWRNMICRCNYPSTPRYADYGGRGIRVCKRWSDRFESFLVDVGPRPSPGHSLDRIDNDGNYEPDNVRWATAAQQMANRRNSRRIVFRGREMTVTEAARLVGADPKAVFGRLSRGWSVDRALTP